MRSALLVKLGYKMQNICIILGGTCPHSTADISHYQNDHNKSSNIKDALVDKLLPV